LETVGKLTDVASVAINAHKISVNQEVVIRMVCLKDFFCMGLTD
jgi:hypothetical protein